MNIAVDFGNTTAKVGIFENEILREKHLFPTVEGLRVFLKDHPAENIIVSSVSYLAENILSWAMISGKKISLSSSLTLPVKIVYDTPLTLGVDRIAAVCGAMDIYPGFPCLVIDAGTCITYEFIDENKTYYGGSISPGIAMRFDAMHTFTSRLPLVQPVNDPPLVGKSTESCMQSGVINGIRAELEGIIQQYIEQHPQIKILLCGGDSGFFENHLKHTIFVAPDLVLTGLNKILQFHSGPIA